MDEENVPTSTRTDDQLVSVKACLPIGKSNLLMDLQKKQKNLIFLISVDILQNINFFRTFTISADALRITPKDSAYPFVLPPAGDLVIDFMNNLGYPEELQFVSKMYVNSLYQPWRTILSIINQCLTGKTSSSDRPRHPVLQMLWGVVTGINVPTKNPKPRIIPYCRFTKLFIYYLGSRHNIHRRPQSPVHITTDGYLLGNLKFISKGGVDEVFGMPIHKDLISDAIRNSEYYPKYLEMAARQPRQPTTMTGEEGAFLREKESSGSWERGLPILLTKQMKNLNQLMYFKWKMMNTISKEAMGKDSTNDAETDADMEQIFEFSIYRAQMRRIFLDGYGVLVFRTNGNSFKPAAQTTTNADGTSTSLIPGLVTTEEKVQKKNDMKARSMLLMVLPNQHLMIFNQYKDAKTLFVAIQIRFGGFRKLSLPSEWNTHVVVWRNKPDLDTMSFDDLYNNFKIVEQEVKRTTSSSSSSSSQNMAFMSSPSSTNEVNTAYGVSTANTQVSPASTQVSTASTQVSTANLSDATVYAFLASQPNGSQLVYEDLEQIHEDDLEEMDLKWQLALLSMRTRSYMADNEVPTNMAPMDFSDSEVPPCLHKYDYDEAKKRYNFTCDKCLKLSMGTCPNSQTSKILMEDMLPLGEEPNEGKLLVKELLKLAKQRKASCKSKIQNSITQPLFMLHMDLFGLTFVSSLMNKKYCLVVTDDYSRFTWVFFLATKDETGSILKSFITEIENPVNKKVKIIRCDNGTEFKNRVMSEFCEKKGIKKEFSIARTP
ncbi:ribonuclease H-like domain-containing protein [Tanacetum coccineum]